MLDIRITGHYHRLLNDRRRDKFERLQHGAIWYGWSLLAHLFTVLFLGLLSPEISVSMHEILDINQNIIVENSERDSSLLTFDFNDETTYNHPGGIHEDTFFSAPDEFTAPEKVIEPLLTLEHIAIYSDAENVSAENLPLVLTMRPNPAQKAITAGLNWLVKAQSADGHWNGAQYEGRGDDGSLTELALFALLQYPNPDHRQRESIARAKEWLTQNLTTEYSAKYPWSMAIGLSIAALERRKGEITEGQLQGAMLAAEKLQAYSGGWSNNFGTEDALVSAWFCWALNNAQQAGGRVSERTLREAREFLKNSTIADPTTPYLRIGVERANTRQHLWQATATAAVATGWAMTESKAERNDREAARSNIAKNLLVTLTEKQWWVGDHNGDKSYLGAFFQSLIGNAAENPALLTTQLAASIIAAQRKTGFYAGSWAVEYSAAPQEISLGRVGATALAILTLQNLKNQ